MNECKGKKEAPSVQANYQCPHCTFTCFYDNEFVTHMSEKHGKTIHCCVTGECTLWFLSQNGLRQHCKKIHSDVLKCDSCQLVCMSNSLLIAYKETSHTAKKGTCPSCNKTFSRVDDAKRHHQHSCPKNPDCLTRCKQCLKEGSEVDVPGGELGLLNHLNVLHFFKGEYLCLYCHRVFDAEHKISTYHKTCTKNKPER